MMYIGIFIGFFVANLVTIALTNEPLASAIERSYFQAMAIGCCWLVAVLREDPKSTSDDAVTAKLG